MPEELEAKIREVLAEHPRLNPDRYEREDKEKIISLRDATRTFFVYEFHNPSKKNQPIDLDPYMTWERKFLLGGSENLFPYDPDLNWGSTYVTKNELNRIHNYAIDNELDLNVFFADNTSRSSFTQYMVINSHGLQVCEKDRLASPKRRFNQRIKDMGTREKVPIVYSYKGDSDPIDELLNPTVYVSEGRTPDPEETLNQVVERAQDANQALNEDMKGATEKEFEEGLEERDLSKTTEVLRDVEDKINGLVDTILHQINGVTIHEESDRGFDITRLTDTVNSVLHTAETVYNRLDNLVVDPKIVEISVLRGLYSFKAAVLAGIKNPKLLKLITNSAYFTPTPLMLTTTEISKEQMALGHPFFSSVILEKMGIFDPLVLDYIRLAQTSQTGINGLVTPPGIENFFPQNTNSIVEFENRYSDPKKPDQQHIHAGRKIIYAIGNMVYLIEGWRFDKFKPGFKRNQIAQAVLDYGGLDPFSLMASFLSTNNYPDGTELVDIERVGDRDISVYTQHLKTGMRLKGPVNLRRNIQSLRGTTDGRYLVHRVRQKDSERDVIPIYDNNDMYMSEVMHPPKSIVLPKPQNKTV